MPRYRPSAKVVLVDPTARTLLFRGFDPARPEIGGFWFTPGGGIDPGETPEQAAVREVAEETGIADLVLGPLIARRRVTFGFEGEWFDADEWVYVARVDRPRVDTAGFTEIERRTITEHRWLVPEEVAALPEPVYPESLRWLLPDLIAGRYPASPLQLTD